MSKKTAPFITEMQVKGTHVERKLERADAQRLAHELIANMPSDKAQKQAYIRNLVVRALRREIEPEVFEEFVSLTNVQEEVDACLARAEMIAEHKLR